jgi:hypothetical protein
MERCVVVDDITAVLEFAARQNDHPVLRRE